MTDQARYRSRRAKLSCSAGVFYGFITDIRNFGKFIREDYIREWEASSDRCRIRIPSVGEASVWISKKVPDSLVSYSGNALQDTEFFIDAEITDNSHGLAEVDITITAHLNPVLKMMASGLIERFLDSVVNEMENYSEWHVQGS